MRFMVHRPVIAGAALCLACLLMPLAGNAALLWGHPYAMQVNIGNQGWVHMWNDLDPLNKYVGSATFPTINFQPGGQNTWDLLVQGMVNKKLTFIWTNAPGGVNPNPRTTGVIQSAVVTIFGN